MEPLIAQHLASPNISLERHVLDRQVSLAHELESREAIYLDIKFWLILRDSHFKSNADVGARELLELLQTLVAEGKAFCPISETTFIELLKQSDPITRAATADLIDKLSLGVALVPFDARVQMEMEAHFDALGGRAGRPPAMHRVWAKLSSVLGFFHPTETGFDASTELAIQKAFFDHLWTVPLSEMVQTIGSNLPPGQDRYDLLATQLNRENAVHAAGLRSFQQTYAIELMGALDVFSPLAAEIVWRIKEKATGRRMSREGAEWSNYVLEMRTYLAGALKTNAVKDALRTLHIHTSLHASLRWNKTQQFDGNDFHDFHHAAAAIGYCDVFLTERGLRSMVTASHVALDRRYGCKVVAQVSEAIDLLRQLA